MNEEQQKWLDKKLFEALATGSRDALMLVELGANMKNIDINTSVDFHGQIIPLISVACEHGDLKLVELLHKNGADINKPDNNGLVPLHHSTLNIDGDCFHDIVVYLVENGAKVNIPTYPTMTQDIKEWDVPLTRACRFGNSETVDFLLNHDADPRFGDALGFTKQLLERQKEMGFDYSGNIPKYENTVKVLQSHKEKV